MRSNEEVDELAHRGTVNDDVGPEPVKTKVNDYVNQEHNICWFAEQGLRQPQALISGPVRREGRSVVSNPRSRARAITGLLTRHNTWCGHRNVIGLVEERNACSFVKEKGGIFSEPERASVKQDRLNSS